MSKKVDIWERQSGLTVLETLTALRKRCFTAFENIFLDVQLKSGNTITTVTTTEIASGLADGLFSNIYNQIEGSDQVDITAEESGTDVEEPKPGVDGRSTSSEIEEDPGNDGRSKTPRRGNRKTPESTPKEELSKSVDTEPRVGYRMARASEPV